MPGGISANKRPSSRAVPAGFPASCMQPSDHSVPTHFPCPTRLFIRSLFSTGIYLWLRVTQSRLGLRSCLAGSPITVSRIGFVILRTGHSPSVAPHTGISPAQSLRLPGVNFSRRRTFTTLFAPTRRRTKLGCSSPAELTRYAIKEGLISL